MYVWILFHCSAGRAKEAVDVEATGLEMELPKAPSSHESASFLHDPIAMWATTYHPRLHTTNWVACYVWKFIFDISLGPLVLGTPHSRCISDIYIYIYICIVVMFSSYFMWLFSDRHLLCSTFSQQVYIYIYMRTSWPWFMYYIIHVYVPLCCRKFINCMMWDGKKSLSQRIFREVHIPSEFSLTNFLVETKPTSIACAKISNDPKALPWFPCILHVKYIACTYVYTLIFRHLPKSRRSSSQSMFFSSIVTLYI